MNINDLMIGDWVNLNFDVDYKTGKSIYAPAQITGINKNGTIDVNCTYDKSESMQDGWDLKLIEPIPLTKDILHKNGFCGEVYLWISAGDEKILEYYPFEHRLSLWHSEEKNQEILFKCHCFYVHELQHALKLCRIEKEIVV